MPHKWQKFVELSEDLPFAEAPANFKASKDRLSRWKTRRDIGEIRVCIIIIKKLEFGKKKSALHLKA